MSDCKGRNPSGFGLCFNASAIYFMKGDLLVCVLREVVDAVTVALVSHLGLNCSASFSGCSLGHGGAAGGSPPGVPVGGALVLPCGLFARFPARIPRTLAHASSE